MKWGTAIGNFKGERLLDAEYDYMSCGLYKIKCLNNGKFYIGSSNNIEKRWILHLSKLRNNKHENPVLQNCYNKYGLCSLHIEIILVCLESDLLSEEQKIIDNLFDNQKKCMNISRLANKPPSCKGKTLSQSHKRKISASNTGKKRSEETRQKIKDKRLLQICPRTGYKASEETKHKMREANKPDVIKSLMSPDGVVVTFYSLTHFCQQHNLSKGHVGELLKGKRRHSVKGWRRV